MRENLNLVPFGWPVVIYLTLAGMAAGAALVSAGGLLAAPASWRRLGSWGLLVSAAAIALGSLFLIADLEAPDRFWLILSRFNPASIISWGTRILLLFALLAAYAGWAARRVPGEASLTPGIKLCVALVAVLALAVALYPAWVLQQATARPLWGSLWIAPLFLLSALHAGLAALSLGASPPGDEGPLLGRRFEVALVAAQVAVAAAYFFTAFEGYDAAATRLVRGDLAAWLWIGVVAVGWLAPLVVPGTGRASVVLRSCSVLVGVLALRAVIVLGGQGAAALLSGLPS